MAIGQDRLNDVAALAWLVSIGADEAIGDEPIDRLRPVPTPPLLANPIEFQRPAPPMAAQPSTAQPLSPPAPPIIRSADGPLAAMAARDLAGTANTLEELREAIARFEGLTLKATATNLVFADGNPQAPLMLIGEAPGAEEDRRGLPFVGVSGQLLDRMLAAIGRDRSNCYITNIVNWRPPGNRKPSPAEMSLSLPFIERHIALIDPALVVLLGDTAAKTLTGRNEGITRLRGKWFTWPKPGSADLIPVLPTFHPAFLLRSPSQKREAWIDMVSVKRKLAELSV